MRLNVNTDIFLLDSKLRDIQWFIKNGHVLRHLIDRFKWHIYPNIYHVPSFPTHVDIESSNVCQMKCPMCARHLMKAKQGLMDFELYKKVIDECAREGVYSVKLSWRGEPLLHPRLFEMVALAKEKGIKEVALLTNAERLGKEAAKELILSGADWIGVSFDGLGETYNYIRYPAKFEEAVARIQTLQDLKKKMGRSKPLVKIQTVYSAIKDDPGAFRDFWVPKVERVMVIADQLRSNDRKDFEHDPNYVCPSPWQRICVSFEGTIAQCHSDYNMANVLGDVRTHSLREIWHGEPFRRLRELHRARRRLVLVPCQTCCDGGKAKVQQIMVGGELKRVRLYADQELDFTSGGGHNAPKAAAQSHPEKPDR
jgi:MoaA/NifB/PqqE/SkfB family radical SAM enzyme